MKIPPDNIMVPPRGLRLRGVIYTRQVNGNLIVARWPKRQTPRSAKERTARELLAYVAICTNYMDAHQVLFSRELARRTQLAPRDIMIAAMWKRLCHIVLQDGRKVFSVAARQDVSDLLDTLGQVRGNILWRGENWWGYLPPGSADQVISIDANGDLYWRDSGGGGPGGGHPFFAPDAVLVQYASPAVSSSYFVGTPVMVEQDTPINGIKNWFHTITTPGTGYGVLYEGDASGSLNGGILRRTGSPVTINVGQVTTFDFGTPFLMIPNKVYYPGAVCDVGNFATGVGNGRNNIFFFVGSGPPPTTPSGESVQWNTNWPAWGF